MTRDAARWLMFLVAGVALRGSPLAAQAAARSPLGRWHGTSVCVKASWNAACNDEEAYYDFVPAPGGPPRLVLHAYKRVGTAIESMGDLEFMPDSGAWVSEFANARVHLRWVFQVSDSGLTGRVVLLPSNQIGRRVRATRDTNWVPSPE